MNKKIKIIIERKACDWQCDSDAEDWDGWQEYEECDTKEEAKQKLKELRKEDEEAEYRMVEKQNIEWWFNEMS